MGIWLVVLWFTLGALVAWHGESRWERWKHEQNGGYDAGNPDWFMAFMALFFPPAALIATWLSFGLWGRTKE